MKVPGPRGGGGGGVGGFFFWTHIESPGPRGGGGGTWVNFCWVCAAAFSEPQPYYSLFFGQS